LFRGVSQFLNIEKYVKLYKIVKIWRGIININDNLQHKIFYLKGKFVQSLRKVTKITKIFSEIDAKIYEKTKIDAKIFAKS
jgi:hypothetical protein